MTKLRIIGRDTAHYHKFELLNFHLPTGDQNPWLLAHSEAVQLRDALTKAIEWAESGYKVHWDVEESTNGL